MLNMIVKNEADKIVRCLESVAPWISSYAVLDTGSSDGTQKIITAYFAEKKIPGVVEQGHFTNFEQARNDALKLARICTHSFNYILLCDADMVLTVTDPKAFDNLTDIAYDIVQTAGGTSYYNRRLIRRDQKGNYIGVTHEYLDIGGGTHLEGVSFVDHADGSNRKDKFVRDIEMLLAGLKKEPENGRYMYYLAQSYRDAGQPNKAAEWYKNRINSGGWDEEVWSARLNYAHCLNAVDDTDGFIRELLNAYNFRPTRAEPLYDLAKHYREHDQQKTSLLYSVEGMKIPYPTDVLFVTDHVYATALREEFAICAFYHPSYRNRGYSVCSDLAIDPKCYPGSREMARSNLYYYLQPLKELCPSFEAKRIDFTPRDGYIATNPSVANLDGLLHVVVRSVNYTMDEEGRYLIKGIDINSPANNSNPIRTRNYLLALSSELRVTHMEELLSPPNMPPPTYPLVIGFEDMRLFGWLGGTWISANVREQNPDGWCEQWTAHIHEGSLINARPIQRTPTHEKNWMPWVQGDKLDFVYRLDTLINSHGVKTPSPVPFAVEALSGGSQVIEFNGGWLAIVHESKLRPGDNRRYYQHRFVWWDITKVLRQISKAFVLHDRQIEFAAGLAWHPSKEKLVISYGIKDCEAWLATVSKLDVMSMFL
jgi:glycosyltransferase involved in cell wall biosynthesis